MSETEREREGKDMFSFFYLGCETSSRFHCVSHPFVCVSDEAPLTLKRLHSWYLTLTDWLAFLSNTLTRIHSLCTIHFPAHKPLSLNLFLSPLLPALVTSLPLSHRYTHVTPQHTPQHLWSREGGKPFLLCHVVQTVLCVFSSCSPFFSIF